MRVNMNSLLTVDLGHDSYPIIIEEHGLSHIALTVQEHVPHTRLFCVTDENVAALYLPKLKEHIELQDVFIILAGESSKSIENWLAICQQFLTNGIKRGDAVMALGGGVVGDIAGFAAASIMRGTKFIQIPTTLLAQVDSAVGGKTAINTPAGKNLIGSFYQPSLVVTDVSTLKTLPKRELIAGYAEVLKYALIQDVDFFEWLNEHANKILECDSAAISHAVHTSCTAKADIVARDEREHGCRALLNLGHTFGHALEGIAGYDGTLLHGEAVLIGMDMALYCSVLHSLAPESDLTRLRAHYDEHDLWPDYKITASADDLITHMKGDKKHTADHMVFILMRGIGAAFISHDLNADQLKEYLVDYLNQL